MGKNYDRTVTPQNTPRFKERRLLFLISIGFLAINLIVCAILSNAVKGYALALVVLMIGFAVVQCLDKRKEMWTWGYLIFCWVLYIVISALFVWITGAYWYFFVILAEIAAFLAFAFYLLTPKRKRRK
jgi:ABC-type polysaccharide/polyol phosphate export permease